MATFIPSLNTSGECCDNPCDQQNRPCDDCCECDDLPDNVEVIKYKRKFVGRSGCRREVFVITECVTASLENCKFVSGSTSVEYLEAPVERWAIGGAISTGEGCEGLFGEYHASGRLRYAVQRTKAGETVAGGFVEAWDCDDCTKQLIRRCKHNVSCSGICGSGVVGSGVVPCGSGIIGDDLPDDPLECETGSGVVGSGVVGSGIYDPECEELDCENRRRCFDQRIINCEDYEITIPPSSCDNLAS